MARFTLALPFVLVLLPERGETFAPSLWKQKNNWRRYPTVSDGGTITLQSSYLDNLSPSQGQGDEDREPVQLDEEFLDGPFVTPSSAFENDNTGGSYLNDLSGFQSAQQQNTKKHASPMENDDNPMMSSRSYLDRLNNGPSGDEDTTAAAPWTPDENSFESLHNEMANSNLGAAPGMSSFVDNLRGGPSSDDVSYANNNANYASTKPSGGAAPTSFVDTRSRVGPSINEISYGKKNNDTPQMFKEAPGMGSFADNLGGGPPSDEISYAKNDNDNVPSSWGQVSAPGTDSFADYLGDSPSSDEVSYAKDENDAPRAFGGTPGPGMGSFADSLGGGPSSDEVSYAKDDNDAPETWGKVAAPGMSSFADSLTGGPSSNDVSYSKNDNDAPKTWGQAAPAMGSFTDSLTRGPSSDAVSYSNNDDAVAEPQGETSAPGMGSFADSLTGGPSSNDVSYSKNDNDAPKTWGQAAPAMGSFADSLTSGPSSDAVSYSNNDDAVAEPQGESSVPGMGSFADSLTGGPSSNDDDASDTWVETSSPGVGSFADSLASSPSVNYEKKAPGMGSFADTLASTPPAGDVSFDEKKEDVVAETTTSGMGSFADSLGGSPSANDASYETTAPGMGSFADSLASSPAANDVSFDDKKDGVVPETKAPGMGSFTDSLARSPSVNDVNDASYEKTTPGMGSFADADSLAGSQSVDSVSYEKNDDAVAETTASFLDQVASDPFKQTVAKDSDQPTAQALGSYLENLRVTASTDDSSSATKDEAKWPSQSRAPGMGSFTDSLTGSQSDSSSRDRPISDKASASGISSFSDRLTSDPRPSEESSSTPVVHEGASLNQPTIPRSPSASDTEETYVTSATPITKEEFLAARSDRAVEVAMDAFRNNMAGAKNDGGESSSQEGESPMTPRSGSDQDEPVPPNAEDSMVRKETEKLPTEETEEGDNSEKDYPDALVRKDELSLEERIASSIYEAKAIGVSKRRYESTRENLRDFKSRTQRRLNVSEYEKERAAEKLASIKSRMEAEARAVQERLDAKLAETQVGSDKEIARIKDLLAAEIEMEVEREENIVEFMSALRELIATKETDIANDEKVTKEMKEARLKLQDGAIAENLDVEVQQRLGVAVIEKELVKVLSECLVDLQGLSEDAHARAALTRATLERLNRPDTRSSQPYDWSDIEEMEQVLGQAAVNVAAAEKRIRQLSQRIDDALVNRAVVLGEDVPPGLAKTAQRAAARSIKKASSSPEIDFGLGSGDFLELKTKDERELLAMFAKSVGSAAFDSSRAAVYGLKAILDTVTGQPAVDAANQIAFEVRKDSADESKKSSALVESKDPVGQVADTVKSTASVLGSVGKAGTTIVKGIGESDSAHVAGEALMDTTKDLFTSLETAAALGVKLYQLTAKTLEETLGGENDLPRIPWADGMKRLKSMDSAHVLKDVQNLLNKQTTEKKNPRP